jgi:hypothetical protein
LNKTSAKQAFSNMNQLIKHTNGLFYKTLMLLLIPVIIITCYNAYIHYGGVGLNYAALNGIDMEAIVSGKQGAMESFMKAFESFIPSVTVKQTGGDIFLNLVNALLILFLDVYFIVLGSGLIMDKKLQSGQVFKLSLRKIFTVMVISLFSSFIITEIESMLFSSVFVTAAMMHLGNKTMITTAVFVASTFFVLLLLLACWLLLYIHFMAIAAVSGRCRLIVSLGYAREILRKNVWHEMLHIAPFVLGGFMLPKIIQALGIAFSHNTVILLTLIGVSTLMEILFTAHMWMYIIPEFFALELSSGIVQKIRDMMSRMMNMQANENGENADNTEENGNNNDNTDTKE